MEAERSQEVPQGTWALFIGCQVCFESWCAVLVGATRRIKVLQGNRYALKVFDKARGRYLLGVSVPGVACLFRWSSWSALKKLHKVRGFIGRQGLVYWSNCRESAS